jgi:hypothetical protein
METYLALAFMVFGLGFFLFVIFVILHDHRESWERRIMEAREFGFGGKHQHDATTLHKR